MKFIALIILLLFMNNYLLFACDCDEPINTIRDFESGWETADFILKIKIKEATLKNDETGFGPVTMEAEVLKMYKGNRPISTIKIYTNYDGGASCYYPFEIGKTYLFYGKQGEESFFESSICDRTGELKDKSFDLKLLAEK